MSYFKTAMLLAGMTALFMGVGYLIGGASGATLALLVAAGMNLFAYWNSDRMVLSMHGAQPVDARNAPDLFRLVADLAARANLPMPKVYIMDNPQPNAFATGRNPENAAVAVTTGLMQQPEPRGTGWRDRARAGPCEAPRHAADDRHRDHRRRDLHGGAVRHVLRRQP